MAGLDLARRDRRSGVRPNGRQGIETTTVLNLTWLPGLLERLALGAVGGLCAYLLAQRWSSQDLVDTS